MTTDYHDFCHRGSNKAWRERFDIGDLYLNAATCKECGYFIRSRNRHDMVYCKCGNIAVDGGSWYAKRTFKIPKSWTDHLELFKGAKTKG